MPHLVCIATLQQPGTDALLVALCDGCRVLPLRRTTSLPAVHPCQKAGHKRMFMRVQGAEQLQRLPGSAVLLYYCQPLIRTESMQHSRVGRSQVLLTGLRQACMPTSRTKITCNSCSTQILQPQRAVGDLQGSIRHAV